MCEVSSTSMVSASIAICETPLTPGTRVGRTVCGSCRLQSPICPPQVHIEPSASTAELLDRPPSKRTTGARRATLYGVARDWVVPSPTCPLWLAPQDHRLPAASTAMLCSRPAAILTAGGICLPTPRGGEVSPPIEPVPSWPS